MRDFLRIYLGVIVIAGASLAFAWRFVGSPPPSEIRFATGVDGGFYAALGERFRAEIEREGVRVVLVPSAGSVENLASLERAEGGVDVAFVQGGIGDASRDRDVVALGSLVYGIIEGPHHGWLSNTSLVIFGVAIVAMGAFITVESRVTHPMLDLKLFKDRRFSVASGGISLTFFAMFGTFFLVAQYFQMVLGYSPLKSGLLQLPMAIVMMSLAPQVPKLVARFGTHRVVPTGLTCTAIGLFVFSQMSVSSPLWSIYVSVVPLAAGMALTMTPLTTLIMSSVPLNRAGVGSAMNDTTRELGGALGVAVLGSVVSSVYVDRLAGVTAGLPAPVREIADSGLGGALAVAEKMGPAGNALADTARQAFVDGMGTAAFAGGIGVLVAAALAARLLPRGGFTPPGAHHGRPGSDETGAGGDVIDEGVIEASPILD